MVLNLVIIRFIRKNLKIIYIILNRKKIKHTSRVFFVFSN
jgi:hypothetical protein